MRKTVSGIMLTLLLIGIVQVEAAVETTYSFGSGEACIDWWPMFRHDLTHTGYSTSKAPNNNQSLWTYTAGQPIGYSSPAVADGKVYIGSYDKNIYALNASTGTLVWSYTTGNIVESSPAVADGKVFVGSYDKNIYALNASTGAVIWNYTTGNPIRYSSAAVADGKVYIGSWDNKLYALNASTGTLVWNYTTGLNVLSSPAVADGKVFVGSSDNKLYALNASTGTLVWSYTTGGSVLSSPAVADGKVFVGSYDKNIYALNASTGTLVWSYTTAGMVDSSPAAVDGKVYIGSRDNRVYALNSSTGAVIWSYTTGGSVLSSPAVADGKVFVGSYNRRVYALNASTGALVWSYTTGGWVYSSPAVADGKVYIGSWNSKVYAFGSHDVAISSVATSTTQALVGQIVDIDVVAKNEGTETETFNVTAYYNGTAIQTQTVTNLASYTETTLAFTWNTTNLAPSNYMIKAIASTVSGETDTVDNTYVDGTVKIINPPVAHFTYYPTTPLTAETVTFNASLSRPDGGTIITYGWNFGDGTPNATGMITTHAYTDNGTYTVTLTITDDEGLTGTNSQNITVLDRPPIASFTESVTSVPTGTAIHFNASASYDPDGSIASYLWDFGDGTNGTGVAIDHAYTDDGTYTVTLTVTDNDGTTATANATKTITNRPPTASFTESATTVYTNEVIQFNASSSFDSDGRIVSYFWDFGDGNNATGVIVDHSYADNGTYTVALTITDDDGAAARDTATKTVLDRAPVASFTESATRVFTDETISFNASDSYDPDGIIVSYFWDFGDGTNATGVTVNHAYAHNGTYTVTLTVIDNDGMSTSTNAIKTVLNRPTGIHDVAITDVTFSKTIVGQGYSLNISVTITNKGNFTETFNFTAYANTTIIGTFMNVILSSENSATVTFTWNTAGFAKSNYTIWAYAWPVPLETYTADNNFTDGWVVVAMVGDLTGSTANPWDFVPDGKVDGKDLSVVSKCFGSWPGAPPPMIWNPNCDINNDGKVDGKDRAIGAKHFGQSDP